MTEVVVDASIVLKSFAAERERHSDRWSAILAAANNGRIALFAPEFLYLEVINVVARKWSLDQPRLMTVLDVVRDFGLERCEPPLERIVRWTAIGLSAYDAAYVASAEALDIPLVTDDERIIGIAPRIAVPLATFEP